MREPNVYVNPNVQSITIGTNTIHMDRLQDGIQRLLWEVKLHYATLINDTVVLKEVPEQAKDDLTNSMCGYLFVSEELFYKKCHVMFFYLVDCYDLTMVDNAGWIMWNIPGIKKCLRHSLWVWEPLYHLLYITLHIFCYGTQFVNHKGVRDFCQGMIMMGHEFIAPDNSYDLADGVLTESADYSTSMDHSHYTIIQGVVPQLPNNSMYILKAALCTATINQYKHTLYDQPMSEIPSLLPSNRNGQPISLDSNLDDLFHNNSRSMTSVVPLSLTASGYIQCGSMLSDSP
ncbi:uncharacterized protein BJ212DRAFT_1296506 [Suillus subaureus]|uniref:Uncharacterized protein n=1 Tax=Suillus subaureus TaxID=48587 RepID=A0A9P7EHR3_9AGAM|nr:uncharacterized protein BJ212DRAFT_1296506 [Suillus subaureus]KAG1822442.1 hypothetical protein BJ212DRAFT_1296506 [Suillus subaureus]